MSNKKTFIDINGLRYDARGGQILGASRPMVKARSIDGISPRPHRATERGAPKTTRQEHTPNATIHNPPSVNHLRSAPQKSKTLMRPAVAKPSLRPKKTIAKPTTTPRDKRPLLPTDHVARHVRATITPKSSAIKRFNHAQPASQATTSVPVRHTAKPHQARSHQAEPIINSHYRRPTSPLEQRLNQAIQHASSHLEQLPKRKRRLHPAHGAASAAAIVLLLGFFAYQNMPNLQMRVAASQAGFAATFPSYSPAGFGVTGPIQTEPGKVSLSFKSRTDNRSFTVQQQASEWTSETLQTTYLKNNKPNLQTFALAGKTVYTYGDSDATWVDDGVWYKVSGNAQLSSDQLQRLAGSL